tara:strand:+ start:375 stop:632 length:258 start_codon:yes stop_codon:yes gene_type:complete
MVIGRATVTGHLPSVARSLLLEMIMSNQNIRIVYNKNGSLTVYVPAKFAGRFEEAYRAGVTDIMESEMDDEEAEQWSCNTTWEYR